MPKNSENLKSAKRTIHERSGIHAWHPYYGGYAEKFVEGALEYLNCKKSQFILDPWGGSGTTSIVASRLGFKSLCIEINPIMAAFSSAKSNENAKYAGQLLEKITTIIASIVYQPRVSTDDDCLDEMFSGRSGQLVRNYIKMLDASDDLVTSRTPIDQFPILYDATVAPPAISLAKAVVFRFIRESLGLNVSSNPAWSSKFQPSEPYRKKAVVNRLTKLAQEMVHEIAIYYGDSNAGQSLSIVGDNRFMKLESKSIDRIITSPPYLTRLDYAISTSPELLAAGGRNSINKVRENTMGTTTMHKNEHLKQHLEWGPTCNAFLENVFNHTSKSAKNYYWKNFKQYFNDLETVLLEIKRVSTRSFQGIFVVQNSYFKEFECDLGQIYVEMARAAGFIAENVYKQRIRGVMTNLNSRSNFYTTNKEYREEFVFLKYR